MSVDWTVQILSLSLPACFGQPSLLSQLVAAHDLHDDAGDHEGEQEDDDVEGYAHYVHAGIV
jgi:hypothetical protein